MLASSLLCMIVVAAGQVGGDGDGGGKWRVVTSKEGNFTVEMPVGPTRTSTKTSNGPGGRVKVNEVTCETSDGAYVVTRVESPGVVPPGAQESFLDFARDYFASQFHGKVTSDKKVRLDGTAGRDFTIRANIPGEGPVEVRAREYIQGKTVYALLVASEPKRPLPAGAAKFLGSFAFGIHPEGTTVKADAREVEATGRELAGWGNAIDPDGDVKIVPSGKSVTLTIPGTLHDLNADIGKFNAPRILRPVDGDFLATVRVGGSFHPAGKSTKEKTYPLNTGGLVMWKDARNYIFLQRTAMLAKGGKINPVIMFEEREAGHRGATHNLVVPAGTVFLRLERKGSRILGAVSQDGSRWAALKPMDTTWAKGPVQVGLAAFNTASEPSTVEFEAYSVKSK